MLSKVVAACMVLVVTIPGCAFRSYEHYVDKECTLFGYQSPPLLISRNDVEIIFSVKRIDLTLAETYRDALSMIAKETFVPIVITGDEEFLDEKANVKGLEKKPVSSVLDKLLDDAGRSYSIQRGWVKVK